MNGRPPVSVEARLRILEEEILRWNRQINLVSRVDTRRVVANLISQCRDGWDLVAAALAGDPVIDAATYVDIGSGAGLPGLVWSALRDAQGEGPGGGPVLVEPRQKRAWFLQRAARRMGLEGLEVRCGRWGAGPGRLDALGAPALLISLKALALDDAEILGGLPADATAGHRSRCVILRFLEADMRTREQVEAGFAGRDGATDPWRRAGAQILGEGDPGILLTSYHHGG